MPNFKVSNVHLIDPSISFDRVPEFLCSRCVNAGRYTEDGFMGHYAITCKLLKFHYGEYEQIIEPDSPNNDESFSFVTECDTFEEEHKG